MPGVPGAGLMDAGGCGGVAARNEKVRALRRSEGSRTVVPPGIILERSVCIALSESLCRVFAASTQSRLGVLNRLTLLRLACVPVILIESVREPLRLWQTLPVS